ncbi:MULTISPECIES: HAMP domain-containing sensor histidine kinase [Actinosynnema]|uniref:sensor histidine kinase n=1 Tax=Actinosynnema TaxID=40566 RepID=UPI0020A2F1A9|nr:HAMP domain-containing sensor histidine kinase [Actinosynnema pretiosum]MCP2096276.1 two-component system, OmpR family, sensor histidine kinase VanS [Actinosynnema pretiosum]
MTARRGWTLTARVRLTLLYGNLVLVSGVALLLAVYFLMRYVPVYELPPAEPPLDAPSEGPLSVPGESAAPAATVTTKDDVLATLVRLSGIALLALALMAYVVGWVVAGSVLSPVHRITETARAIAGRTLHERIRLRGGRDEFTDLADALDTMLDRLHASFQVQRRFTANASHELRTPLATTRTMLQVAIAHPEDYEVEPLARKLLATNDRSITTVESLLALAKADNGVVDAQPVDLAGLAEEVLGQVRAEAEAHGVRLEDELRPVTVLGDRALLHHLVVNLVQNAVRHNRSGGEARLLVGVGEGGGEAVVTVVNTGERIDDRETERLFEPFHRLRARTRAPGHGLGLALVRTIAHGHGGTAEARANPAGGLTVTVALPRGQPGSGGGGGGSGALGTAGVGGAGVR